MKRTSLVLIASLIAFGLPSPASAGNLTVGSGATFDLGTGSLGLGCADLDVAGTLTAGTVGFSAARDVAIVPGGTLNANSATLSLSGDWDNAGTFNAGTSTVQMADGCSLLSAVVAGNSSFANFAINTTSAKLVSFTTGSTQTVTGLLTLLGAEGSLLQIRSTLSGSLASFNVTGSSSASFVNVDDNDARPGNDIFLPANSVKGPNTPGWLSASQVPLLGPVAMGLLMLLLFVSGQLGLRRSTRAEQAL